MSSSELRIGLSEEDVAEVGRIIGDLSRTEQGIETPLFLQQVALAAHGLPSVLRDGLLRFRLQENWPVCVIRGFLIDNERIGDTPRDSMDPLAKARTRIEDTYLMLACHLLGDAVAFATEHEGHLIHEVLPIAGNEGRQRGNSTDPLDWHTEHAFHEERMDYVILLCLRNHDQVPTTFSYEDNLKLDERARAVLARAAFPYKPDDGNRATGSNRLSSSVAQGVNGPHATRLVNDLLEQSYVQIEQMLAHPPLVPALFGGASHPYVRIHPHYVGGFGEDVEASVAFEKLKSAINESLEEIILSPGDLLLIDNYRAVHGRRPIPGRYDGSDRWLKRAFVTRDLRKTRHLRESAAARVIY